MAKPLTLREQRAHDYMVGITHLIGYHEYHLANGYPYRRNKYLKTLCGARTLNRLDVKPMPNVVYYDTSGFKPQRITANCPECLRQHAYNLEARKMAPQ